MDTTTAPTPGLDPGALTAWWQANVDEDLDGSIRAEIIHGGKSNLTYLLTDGSRNWVARRPPMGHVLATAHDMAREYHVMSALAATDVPVPAMVGICTDPSVLGAPFYVMSHVPGTAYSTACQLAAVGPERTRRISAGMVDTLATLHALDPTVVGLADFGRPEGFLQRQIERWKKQLDASRTRDLPAADELYRLLQAGVGTAERAGVDTIGVIHGDYRLDNILTAFDEVGGDRPAAVIDWEMATLGDTLTDIALLVIYGRGAELLPGVMPDASAAPGFLSETEILARYAHQRGADLSELGFHLGLASFKLVAILEGIHFRYLQGRTVGTGFDRVAEATDPLVDAGLASVRLHS